MTLREIKKKYKLPSKWNKSEVLCYFKGFRKGIDQQQSLFKDAREQMKNIELNFDWKYIMSISTPNSVISILDKKVKTKTPKKK